MFFSKHPDIDGSLIVFRGVIIMFFVTMALTIVFIVADLPSFQVNRAEVHAQEYMKSFMKIAGSVSCAPDTDDNGYGTCTIKTDSGDTKLIQCPSKLWMSIAGGKCKEVFYVLSEY